MRALIVKTSSLGDLIHTLPAISDAAAAVPGLSIDWLAERSFAEVPGWHPAVRQVIRCDLRAWRHLPWREGLVQWGLFKAQMALRDYDLVVDAQGLLKSALLARQARGRLVGPDFRGVREPLAALLYSRRIPVPGHERMHAVDRLRRLLAGSFGYPLPGGDPVSGLDCAQFPVPAASAPWDGQYVLLLHGTTWPSKRWPMANWQALAAYLAAKGLRVVLPWGNADEAAAAAEIATVCEGHVLPRLGLSELASWLAHARLVVGVDTGLAHLAAALGKPQVTLYGPTLPALTGAIGRNQVWLRSGEDLTIDRSRPTTVTVARVQQALEPWL